MNKNRKEKLITNYLFILLLNFSTNSMRLRDTSDFDALEEISEFHQEMSEQYRLETQNMISQFEIRIQKNFN